MKALHWYAEVTMTLSIQDGPGSVLKIKTLALRGFALEGGYALHKPFDAILFANVFEAQCRAFLYGFKSGDGAPLSRNDYRALTKLLRSEYGVTMATADRDGHATEMAAGRWMA